MAVGQITTYRRAGLYFHAGGLLLKLDPPGDHLITLALQGPKNQPRKMLKEGLGIIARLQVTPGNFPSGGFPQPHL